MRHRCRAASILGLAILALGACQSRQPAGQPQTHATPLVYSDGLANALFDQQAVDDWNVATAGEAPTSLTSADAIDD